MYSLGRIGCNCNAISGIARPSFKCGKYCGSQCYIILTAKFKIVTFSKLEDFMALRMNSLIEFLRFHGLNTSGRRIELTARASSAVEFSLPIIKSTE